MTERLQKILAGRGICSRRKAEEMITAGRVSVNGTELVDAATRVYPVGRLDMASEGLLLLTNDGEFANKVMHPKAEVDKIYEAWVRGYSESGLATLKQPMEMDGYTIRTPKIKVLGVKGDGAHLQITIHEGRNRQVRRMCSHAGMTVTRLRRIGEGSLRLGSLEKGKWRYLTAEEMHELMK